MIDTFFNIFRKFTIGIIALIFTFTIVYIPQKYSDYHTVPEAEALFGVDIPNLIQNTISAVVAIALKLKEFILDPIAWVVGKGIMARMVADLVDWINSGFADGGPAFIKDLDQFLLEIANEEIGSILEDLGEVGSFLCSPFKLDIQVAIAQEYEKAKADQPYKYEGCTLTGVIDNLEDFLDGDFEKGGWKDWLTITSEPGQYTPYGQLNTAKSIAKNRLEEAGNKEVTQVNWGDGFKQGKSCKDVKVSADRTKKKCEVVKPNSLINDAIKTKLKAGQDSLVAADEISEIIGALLNQLANKAITGTAGLLGLSSGTNYTYDGYAGGSYISAVTAEQDKLETEAKNKEKQDQAPTTSSELTKSQTDSAKIAEVLAGQESYKALADSQIPILQLYLTEGNNSIKKRVRASEALAEAQNIRDITTTNIPTIKSLRDKFLALEVEYGLYATTEQRRIVIRQEEQAVMNQISGFTLYTQAQIEISARNWDPYYY